MKSTIALASFALALATGAFAQDEAPSAQHGGHGAFLAACGNDLKTYCPSAQSREDRHACIEANKDKLSDTCKTFLSDHAGHWHGQGGGQ